MNIVKSVLTSELSPLAKVLGLDGTTVLPDFKIPRTSGVIIRSARSDGESSS